MPTKLPPPHRLAILASALLFALLALRVPLQVLVPARAQAPAPSPASNEISLVFEREPKSSGISFVPEGLKWGEIEVEGKKEAAWIAQRGSFPEDKQGFARAVKFVISDPRFKNGLQRAVDVEVEYLFRPDSNIRFLADTGEGEKMVHQAFGGAAKWKTAKFSLDNARFGTEAPNPDKKFDLRITAWGEADLGIRSIKIKGFDFPGVATDYARLLKLESINDPDDVLLFRRNVAGALSYNLRNLSGRPMQLDYSISLADRAGARRGFVQRALTIPANSLAPAALTIDTKMLPFGVYSAKFALKTPGVNAQTLIERESYIGMASAARLGKAKEGEFLYGLDAVLGPASGNPRLLKWMDAMGVDIIRHGFGWDNSLSDIEERIKVYDAQGLKVMYNTEPRYNADPAKHQANIDAIVKFVGEAARRFPQIGHWELGNEPDLGFFYPGPIEAYNKGMVPVYRAIKAANPRAYVVNGGLSFAGDEGTARARRFIEILDLNTTDAIAYHGHGAGAAAERRALENVRRVAREFNKESASFVETESGVSAHTPAQEDMQARTAIQKMVYAQSQKMPLFLWFRLLMFEEEYGNLRTEQEPRPVVLAYRAMVQSLRGHKYLQTIETDREGVEAYGFAQNGANALGRAVVLWASQPGLRNVYLHLGKPNQKLANLRQLDMFGNAVPLETLPDGAIRIAATESPTFLKWEASDPISVVRAAAPLLQTPGVAQLVLDSSNTFRVGVRNPFKRPITATVSLSPSEGVPATVALPTRQVKLAPLASQNVDFALKLGSSTERLSFPVVWSAFPNIDPAQVDLAQITAIPDTLPGKAAPVAARQAPLEGNTITFDKLGGVRTERAPAVAFAYLDSDSEQTIKIGASADFWMAWFVNGKPVFDTLKVGNGGGYSIQDHVFDVPLKKGRNLLAVQVLAGSQGWKVLIGSPAELKRTQQPMNSERLLLSLSEGGKTISREAVEVQFTSPIGPVAGLSWTDSIAQWEKQAPEVSLGRAEIINPGEKTPDSKLWWKGEDDLSARAWLSGDERRLYLVVRVRDEAHRTGSDAARMWESDSLQVGVARQGVSGFNEYTLGQVEGRAIAWKQVSAGGAGANALAPTSEVQARIERDEALKQTVYRVSIDRAMLGAGEFMLNFIVNDNDSGFRKQFLPWRPGIGESKDSTLWRRAVLRK